MALTGTALVLIFIFIIISINYGLLFKTEIKEINHDSFFLVYKKYRGNYKNIKKIINSVYHELLHEKNVRSVNGFALYIDNPLHIEQNRLRSLGGCILNSADEKLKKELQNSGFEIMEIKKGKALYTRFPFKGDFSSTLALYKVYPKFLKKVEKNSFKPDIIMEVFNISIGYVEYYAFYNTKKKEIVPIYESESENII